MTHCPRCGCRLWQNRTPARPALLREPKPEDWEGIESWAHRSAAFGARQIAREVQECFGFRVTVAEIESILKREESPLPHRRR